MLAKGFDGKTTLMTVSFLAKGFTYKDQTEELFIVMVSFWIFTEHDIFKTISLISIFWLQHMFKGMISPIYAESAVKSQSLSYTSKTVYDMFAVLLFFMTVSAVVFSKTLPATTSHSTVCSSIPASRRSKFSL